MKKIFLVVGLMTALPAAVLADEPEENRSEEHEAGGTGVYVTWGAGFAHEQCEMGVEEHILESEKNATITAGVLAAAGGGLSGADYVAQRLWRWKPSRVSDVKYDAAGNITHYLAVCGSNATAVRNKIVGKLATGVGYAFGVNGRRCYVEAVATLSTKNKKDWKGTMCTDEGENYDLMMRTKPLVLEANGGVELGKCDRWVLYATVGAARTGNAATLARNCHDKSSRIALKLGVAGVMPTAKGDLMLEISTRHGRKSRIEARELAIEEQMSGLLAGPETQFTAKLKGYHDNHQKIECRLSWRLYL